MGIPTARDWLEIGTCPSLSPHHGYRFSPVRRGNSSSCRTPMRYPWWRPGGDPFGYGRVRRRYVPPLSPHHGYRFSPVRRGNSSSCRTPMRYPWWGPGEDPFGYGRVRRRYVPPLSPHHGYRFSPVRRGNSSSCRTPMRYPWWEPGGDPFGHGPAEGRYVPPTLAPHHGYRFSPVRRGGGHHVIRTRIGLRGDPVSSTGQAVLLPVDEVGAVRAIFIPKTCWALRDAMLGARG